ncbi:response regulator transcription factor [Olivibacter sitiensis]|uniref:response regulator transcription factor n=1 Tax=Olivibacter sitiensis TaxID=376470 RepID=UPI0006848F01|nr:helix-turn-helix transcriptional regulator [Olivibacter sitiensis]
MITFLFIGLEAFMLFYQLVSIINRPSNKHRLYFIVLLLLLIVYNFLGWVISDQTALSQGSKIYFNIIAYGSGFLLSSYIPFYFFKGLELKNMKFHAHYGTWLFIFLPFIIFLCIEYPLTQDLEQSVQHAVVLPFFYSIVLIIQMYRAIYIKFKYQFDLSSEAYLTYLAVIPWVTLPAITFFQYPHAIEIWPTNIGMAIIAIIFVRNDIRQQREEDKRLLLFKESQGEELFIIGAKSYNLTQREIEIALLIWKGNKYKDIAERLFISPRTVTTHVQNIYSKTGVSSRLDLIRKLESKK